LRTHTTPTKPKKQYSKLRTFTVTAEAVAMVTDVAAAVKATFHIVTCCTLAAVVHVYGAFIDV